MPLLKQEKVPTKRVFNIVAMHVRIVYNKWGDHDPQGMMYALKENESLIRELVKNNPLTPVDLVQPLVIRANVGEQIVIHFENKLNFPASMHVQGLSYDVLSSDGAAAGYNPITIVEPNKKITYTWHADREGTYLFNDLGNPLSDETGSNVHGLFGAIIVEAPGSTWTDSVTGKCMESGIYTDIHNSSRPSFREFPLIFHDEVEIKNAQNVTPIDPMTGHPSFTHAINYRSEPMRNRMMHHDHPCNCESKCGCGPDCKCGPNCKCTPEHKCGPNCKCGTKTMESHSTECSCCSADMNNDSGCIGEDCMHSSWVWGDPATPVLHAYVGDPAKLRLVHGGVKETHVFHLHVYQWRLDPKDPNSTLVDSISFGPQETYTIEPLFGAGSLQKGFGDAIFHCHLYPHFADGMWGLWRTHNTLEDGSRFYPDGSPIKSLIPLPDRPLPPKPTADKPGYPLFIPGTVGKKSPRPPLGLVNGRQPTELEMKNFAPNAVPGAAYVNPAPDHAPVRKYNIVAIQLPIKYNSQNWHDPQGRVYVLAEDEEEVLNGEKEIEPLIIRANAGDCIEITFTNKLPEKLGGNLFQTLQDTIECSCHVHLVKFDPLCSDGGHNGWNYDTSAPHNQTMRYRWYADSELRTCFFHDHLFANFHQQHGLFAALIVEPKDSTYHHPKSGNILRSGTKAIIKNPHMPDYREFVLAVHDFALLFDKDDKELNPPPFPDSHEDPGVMGINYRCEPFKYRNGDPAYVFSSYVHGDPATPLLECYAGDPVRIRLFDGAHEEQHCFNIHGYRFKKEPTDPRSPIVSNQTLGISEAFNFEFIADGTPYSDHDALYYFSGLDDLWLGLWGIMRVYGSRVDKILPLEDRPVPPERNKPLPVKTGLPPQRATNPGMPCKKDSKIVRYNISAIQKNIVYNCYGDHDPNGLLFVLDQDKEDVIAGKKPVEPLIIRANAGDCIEIKLTNCLPEVLAPTDYPNVPVESPWLPSNRVSLHAQKLKYFMLGSDGATVGFNPDQTVGPGESILYRWFADMELGTIILSSFGDVRNHRHRGMFAVLIIEPEGSYYLNPITGKRLYSGAQAVIKSIKRKPFREFVVVACNGINMLNKAGERIKEFLPSVHIEPEEEEEEMLDFEDQGQKAFNYRSERFENRLKVNKNRKLIFNSNIHGDPSTPLFRAYINDPVVFRYAMAGDKPRNTTIVIHDHAWQSQPMDINSNIKSVDGALSIGDARELNIIGGAGGEQNSHGDFIYRSGIVRWDLEQGLWGIFRVFSKRVRDLIPLVTRKRSGNKCEIKDFSDY